MASASPDWRTDVQGRFLVEDISVWIFLKMTQPEERERTVGWFWYSSCLLFSKRGDYDETLRGLGLNRNDEGRYYSPWHFIHVGEWSVEDLAWHFYNCGLRSKQANVLFYEFARNWLGKLSAAPKMPDWAHLPTPWELFNRKKAQWAFNPRQLQAAQGSYDVPETSAVSLSYDDPSRVDQEPTLNYESAAPQTEDNMPVDRAEDPPLNFDGDSSRM